MRKLILKFSRDAALEAEHAALAAIGHQLDLAGLAGVEAPRGAGRNIEPHAARRVALEAQRLVGLEEMIMRADLDRPVARVGDLERHALGAGVELDLAGLDEQLTGNHARPSIESADGRSPAWCRRGRSPRPGSRGPSPGCRPSPARR